MIEPFTPILSSRLDGVGEYYFSSKLREIDELRKQGRDIISLGIGSPDMPPHPSVTNRLAVESAKATPTAISHIRGQQSFVRHSRRGIKQCLALSLTLQQR